MAFCFYGYRHDRSACEWCGVQHAHGTRLWLFLDNYRCDKLVEQDPERVERLFLLCCKVLGLPPTTQWHCGVADVAQHLA